MRIHFDRNGRYRGHSEGAGGLILRGLLVLLVLGWPTAIWHGALGWAAEGAWLILLGALALASR